MRKLKLNPKAIQTFWKKYDTRFDGNPEVPSREKYTGKTFKGELHGTNSYRTI
jgi:hypothetical protein